GHTPLRTRGAWLPAAHRPPRATCAAGVSAARALFKADVAEHRPLEVLVASHLSCLGRSWMASDRSGPHGRRRRIFQRPAKPAVHLLDRETNLYVRISWAMHV